MQAENNKAEMTLNDIISKLNEYGVENPREEALLILEETQGISRAQIMLDTQKTYTGSRIFEILKNRRERIPLQYILGKWEFMGKEFFVSPDCLIPRPDTEILVEKALTFLKKGDHVADLCTGSGCIGISLSLYKPGIDLTLVDISSGALEMAKKNASAHGVDARFILGDIRTSLPNEKFDLIISNPPYIKTRDIENLSPEVKKEPALALDGGDDGLDLVRFLINDCPRCLNDGGKMIVEFGYDQENEICELLSQASGFSSYQILYDYGKNPRAFIIYK